MGYQDLQTPEDVEDVMAPDSGPSIIDFWGPHCGPCLAMAPHFEHVAKEYAEEPISFYKINTQQRPELAAPFHIRAVPTLLFVMGGEIIDLHVGALDAAAIAKRADLLLSKARGEGFFHRLFGLKKKK